VRKLRDKLGEGEDGPFAGQGDGGAVSEPMRTAPAGAGDKAWKGSVRFIPSESDDDSAAGGGVTVSLIIHTDYSH
jgi:hypothetical protein